MYEGRETESMYIEKIMDEYGGYVYSFALSRLKNESDAADVYQNVFTRLFEKQPDFSSKQQLKIWILKTAYNCIADIFRARSRECELTNDIEDGGTRDGFYDIIDTLPEKYRDAVYLYYGEGFKIHEISAILGISQSGVKSRLTRAKQMLREELQ